MERRAATSNGVSTQPRRRRTVRVQRRGLNARPLCHTHTNGVSRSRAGSCCQEGAHCGEVRRRSRRQSSRVRSEERSMSRSTPNGTDAASSPLAPSEQRRGRGRHTSHAGERAMKSSRVSLAAVVVAGRHAQRQPCPRPRTARQYRDRVEPDRGEYAGRAPWTGGWSTAFCPDPRGDGAGRRLRCGQRDHAETLPAVSP